MHRKLLLGPAAAGFGEPIQEAPLDRVQEAFQPRHHGHRPVTPEVYEQVGRDLKPVLPDFRVDHAYSTSDGRLWTALYFRFSCDHLFMMLFPRFENGSATGHVTLYCDFPDPDPKEVESVCRIMGFLFISDLKDEHRKQDK
ncbi:MAG TPA: hypothetical protein VF696_00210 [Candidatus Paceibacterota bacterium]